jgi:hypothetical protein
MRAQLMDRPVQTAPRRTAMDSGTRALKNEWPMRHRLARRLFALTDTIASESTIVVEPAAQWAMAVVDGVMFLLRGSDLVVVRRCAHCGAGRFESAPITHRGDLSNALTVWQPFHCECEPTDPPDDVSW